LSNPPHRGLRYAHCRHVFSTIWFTPHPFGCTIFAGVGGTTGSERLRDREEFLANGAAAVLHKHATFDDLVRELSALKRFV
jgi:hypothetical protein